MAPALTKILKEGHGIHLSSPPAPVRLDSDPGSSARGAKPEPHTSLTDDGADALQKMWLNLSSFPLDVPPADPVASPRVQAPAGQHEPLFLPGPASLLSLLSFNSKGPGDSRQVACIFPGMPDVFLVPLPDPEEGRLLHGHGAGAAPNGGDVHRPPFALAGGPPSYFDGEMANQGCASFFAPPPALTRDKAAGLAGPPLPLPVQVCGGGLTGDRPLSGAVLEEAVKQQLSRQAALHSRAQRLQRRLRAVLGEHAVRHCCQQLEGLRRHCQPADVSLRSTNPSAPPPPADRTAVFPWLDSAAASASLTELREFSRSSQALLRGLQEGLDSDATASSSGSSDEEQEEDAIQCKRKTFPASSCEGRWLEERAELGSRWSWLQLRLAELDGRTQQLTALHKHMRSTKGGVVLAAAQPLTDRQIQQTLLREMAGLSCTAPDADAEPCSPTRLLHNIERQSAQLSQIVNSLMPPLSFSPLSKQPQNWKGKRASTSLRGDSVFVPGSSKRRRLGSRRLFKADESCVCARTRPLVTYHKPKLFTLNAYKPSTSQDSGQFTCTLPSSLSTSSCSCCSSCDPVVLCSGPECSSSRASMSTSLFDTPQPHHIKRTLAREEWSQRPLVVNVQPSSPAHYDRRSSTPLHSSHKYKQHARHHKSRVMGLSPIGMAGCASARRRASQRQRKRRHIHRLKEDVLYQLCDPEDSSDEVLEESYTQVSSKQVSQGFVRKRQGESVYNINNIVIPMSLAKVEKLQYKEILTPSWRAVDTSAPFTREVETEEVSEDGQVEEDLTTEVFAQRHLALEQREKLRWSSWGKRKCCRRPKRSGSRLSSSGGGACTSGEEESSAELSCAQLDTDEQPSSEEWLPQAPWELRVFPLGEEEERALFSDDLEEAPSGWSECDPASPRLTPAGSCGATLPSGGQSKGTTATGS